ncbi:MAG: hypothetical protein AAFV43_14235 [Planctomycetota bacterium]
MKPAYLIVLLAAFAGLIAPASSEPPALWTETPYHVAIRIEYEGHVLRRDGLADRVNASLRRQLSGRLGEFWRVDLTIASGLPPYSKSASDVALPDTVPPDAVPPDAELPKTLPAETDKLIVVRVVADGAIDIVGREYDLNIGSWGAETPGRVDRLADLSEAMFDVVTRAFRPLASFDVDPDDAGLVRLTFRGARLGATRLAIAPPGAMLAPFTLRLDRDGQRVTGGARQALWTYLKRSGGEADASEPSAQVISHTRLPFGARRRGRVEQLALTLDAAPSSTVKLRVVDQQDTQVGLRGYEVFTTPLGKKTPVERVGRTNAAGEVVVRAKGAALVHVRCGASVVASLPVVPGAEPLVEVPLLNETARLQAETRLNQLQEELVDVSAQRTILMRRARSRLEAGKADEAERFLREIDAMPARSQFTQQLDRLSDLYRANHPVSQRRLDRLFELTRGAIASAFNRSELRDLESAVTRARRAGA